MSKSETIQPEMLEDAVFSMAKDDSEFDIWVTTTDGNKHGFIASEAIEYSNKGGKGPNRLRDWMARVWFFNEFVRKPGKLIKSIHDQPDDGSKIH